MMNPVSEPLILQINEVFFSIQGESTHAGRPCVFVRLAQCNRRCSYCDTTYAYDQGQERSAAELIEEIARYDCRLVEITGGEPLLQDNVHPFMRQLCDLGYEVLLETGGHEDISAVDERVKRIMDIKCPSSGEAEGNRWENIGHLRAGDEVKFVIGNRDDYDWAKAVVGRYQLAARCTVLFSSVFGVLTAEELARWILNDHLDIRLNMQLHKIIWPPHRRGV